MESFERKRRAAFSLRGVVGTETSIDSAHAKARDKAKAKARRGDTIGHLGPEAVAAFVDGEMEPKAKHRVRVHLVHCSECRADVHEQRHASEWLRQCNVDAQVRVPKDLMAKLAGIASDAATVMRTSNEARDEEVCQAASPQDFLDKFEMVIRAVKHNQGRK